MSLVFLIVAILCFILAGLLAVGAFAGGNEPALIAAGLAAFAASFLPGAWPR